MFNNTNINLEDAVPLIKMAIAEDIKDGDITTDAIVTKSRTSTMYLLLKENGVIAGLPVIKLITDCFNQPVQIDYFVGEGQFLTKGTTIAKITADIGLLLKAERTILNFLQRLSGIATKTYKYAEIIKNYNTKILDTRKTLPGHRLLDKYAVRIGGGCNHRFGLYDMVMIKDNHIKAAGSITNAVNLVRQKYGNKYKIEVETSNLNEVEEALKVSCDIIMLDNMSLDLMKTAAKLIGNKALTEASGNITEEKLVGIAEIGINYVSIGALTHSVKALDISGKINIGE